MPESFEGFVEGGAEEGCGVGVEGIDRYRGYSVSMC